jgi:hypothetical protein
VVSPSAGWALALLVVTGFLIQKGGICAVYAVDQVLSERKASRFFSFLICVAAVAAVAPVLAANAIGCAETMPAYPLTTEALVGAAVFGVGAVINRSCAFGSIAHIGRGELAYAAMLPGLVLGFAAGEAWLSSPIPAIVAARPFADAVDPPLGIDWLAGASAAIVLAVLANTWMRRDRSLSWRARATHARWQPPVATAAIGVCGALACAVAGGWTYIEAAQRLVRGLPIAAAASDAMLFLALLAGAVFAAGIGGTLKLAWPDRAQSLRSLIGGLVMGIGATLVPGGNDWLVLRGMPALTLHAWVAYAAMTAAIAVTIVVARRLTR